MPKYYGQDCSYVNLFILFPLKEINNTTEKTSVLKLTHMALVLILSLLTSMLDFSYIALGFLPIILQQFLDGKQNTFGEIENTNRERKNKI